MDDRFFDLFRDRLRELAAIYHPVSIFRLYPFLSSYLRTEQIEPALREAQARGICNIKVLEPIGSSTSIRVAEIPDLMPPEYSESPPTPPLPDRGPTPAADDYF